MAASKPRPRRWRRAGVEPGPPRREAAPFLANLRPLAAFCKLFGSFHASAPDGRTLRHRWLSLDTLWAVALHLCAGHLLYTHERSAWWRFLAPSYYAKVAVSLALCVAQDRRLPQLVRTIERFDAEYRRGAGALAGYKAHLGKVWTAVTALGVVLCVSAVALSRRNGLDWFELCLSFVIVVMGLQRHLYVSTFSFFCYYLTRCFNDLRSEWRVRVRTYGQRREELERVRLLHCRLARATRLLADCYGARLAFYLAWFFAEYLLDLYELVYVTPWRSNNQIFFTTLHLAVVTLVVSLAGNLTASGMDMGLELSATPLTQLSEQCQVEVHTFVSQLLVTNLDIDAAGFCTVNRGILVSLAMSVTTYFIVVLQFAPQLTLYTDRFKPEYQPSATTPAFDEGSTPERSRQ